VNISIFKNAALLLQLQKNKMSLESSYRFASIVDCLHGLNGIKPPQNNFNLCCGQFMDRSPNLFRK